MGREEAYLSQLLAEGYTRADILRKAAETVWVGNESLDDYLYGCEALAMVLGGVRYDEMDKRVKPLRVENPQMPDESSGELDWSAIPELFPSFLLMKPDGIIDGDAWFDIDDLAARDEIQGHRVTALLLAADIAESDE